MVNEPLILVGPLNLANESNMPTGRFIRNHHVAHERLEIWWDTFDLSCNAALVNAMSFQIGAELRVQIRKLELDPTSGRNRQLGSDV